MSPLIPLSSSIFMLCMNSVEPSRIQVLQSCDPVLSPELSADGIIGDSMNWRTLTLKSKELQIFRFHFSLIRRGKKVLEGEGRTEDEG